MTQTGALSGAGFFNGALAGGRRPGAPNTKEKGKAAASPKTFFGALLNGHIRKEQESGGAFPIPEGMSSEEALGFLWEEARAAGAELLERPFPPQVARYKESVRVLMGFIVERAYDVENKAKPGRFETKSRVQVVVLDQKLERLAAEVIGGQLSQLNLLARIEEINGILIDLLE